MVNRTRLEILLNGRNNSLYAGSIQSDSLHIERYLEIGPCSAWGDNVTRSYYLSGRQGHYENFICSNFDSSKAGTCGSEIQTMWVRLRYGGSNLGRLSLSCLGHFAVGAYFETRVISITTATDWIQQSYGMSAMWGLKPWFHCAIIKVHPMLKDRGHAQVPLQASAIFTHPANDRYATLYFAYPPLFLWLFFETPLWSLVHLNACAECMNAGLASWIALLTFTFYSNAACAKWQI